MRKSTFASLGWLVLMMSSPIPLVQGLNQDEIVLSFDWSRSTYYQGDRGSVTISLESTCGNELEFTWIGIHFAWMRVDYYYPLDLENNPVRIPSGGSTTFYMSFAVGSDADVGWNEYYVVIHYDEHHWYGWDGGRWESSTKQIYIHDAFEKTYRDLHPEVLDDLDAAKNANYESPDAKSLVTQAQNQYDLAVSLANQDKWESAVSHLQTTSNKLVQAIAEEESHWAQKASEAIAEAEQRIDQLDDFECLEAQSLSSKAQSKLLSANSAYNSGSLPQYKNACDFASQAISYVNQASTTEQEYQQEKQEASEAISSAEQKISQTVNAESAEAKQLLQQAQNLLLDAQNALAQETTDGCESALSSAEQALSYATQAVTEELAYQEQKRQQLMTFVGIGVIVVVAITSVIIVLRRKGG